MTGAPARRNRAVRVKLDDQLMRIPNIQAHGTRSLIRALAGNAIWGNADSGADELHAKYQNRVIGMMPLNATVVDSHTLDAMGRETAQRLAAKLSPRAVQSMIAVSALIYEKTRGQPVNTAVTVNLREIALTMRYKPNATRTIDPEIYHGLATDLLACTRVFVWGATGAVNPKSKRPPTGWLAPLLLITAVRISQEDFDGHRLPIEFDAMLGRPWAEAMLEKFDVAQITPGLMDLSPTTEGQAIKLGMYYLTDFRYRMTKTRQAPPVPIEQLCQESGIAIDSDHAKRFLERLDNWHRRLQAVGVIGSYQRIPDDAPNDWTPGRLLREGTYQVTLPVAIADAYAAHKKSPAIGPKPRRKRAASPRPTP